MSWYWPAWGKLTRAPVVFLSLAAIAAIAVADWLIEPNVSLGALYFLPLVFLAAHLSRGQVIAVCIACAGLREVFGPYPLDWDAVARVLFVLASYAGTSLFVNEIFRSRREALDMLAKIRAETAARRESEARLRAILDSTPVGVLVLNREGSLLLANHTATKLLPLDDHGKPGTIATHIPGLASLVARMPSTTETPVVVELPAWRADGQQFLARLWVASSGEESNPVIAVALTDISEEVRDAEMAGLEDLIAGSRVVLGAVSHEIRNLAAAIGVEVRNLSRSGGKETGPLQTLSAGLERLAAAQLETVHPRSDARADVARVLNEMAVIMGPEFVARGAALRVEAPDGELWARADYRSLVQVLLNLLNNAVRQCGSGAGARICRVVAEAGERITLRVFAPGAPVARPERLFQPFSADAEGTGLGLYVSRGILRSSGGDLRYDTGSDEPCFVVELAACPKPAA